MPPRKKPNSSSSSSTSKKPNPQPSKYGIQHFFDRHTVVTSQKHQADNATSQVVSEKLNDGKGPSQNTTPPDNLVLPAINAAETPSDVSPEISKSVSLKRFKFSPGMVTAFVSMALIFVCWHVSWIENEQRVQLLFCLQELKL